MGGVKLVLRWLPCPLLALLAACSAESYHRSADREVYGIIADKRKQATGRDLPFQVEQQPIPLYEVGSPHAQEDLKLTPTPKPAAPADARPPASPTPEKPEAKPDERPAEAPPPAAAEEKREGKSGDQASVEQPSDRPAATPPEGRLLNLEEAIRVALANNREYQSRKETVYLTALALTLARYQFAPRFFGIVGGAWTRAGNNDRSGEISTDFGWNRLFANGARLGLHALNNFSQFFTGDRRAVAQTIFRGTITQPLLRGFGRHIVQEPLTQSERNALYEIRNFERFRQTFAIEIFSEYYGVLLERNRVNNEYSNWQDLVNNLERVEWLARAERLPKFEVDQARQQELQARNRWVVAVESYESALDQFKIALGVPTDFPLSLDLGELERLEDPKAEAVLASPELAIESALENRLDLKVLKDQVEDGERHVKVAADALRTQLDLRASAALPSSGGDAQTPLKFDVRKGTYSAGFDLNLPFDRKAERNDYVETLIALERAKRDLSLLMDNIRLRVRDAFRRVERERQSFEIQKASVQLATVRVQSTRELLQAGRAETRDLLESQSALIDAKNALIAAKVNFTIAWLEFFRDTGNLLIDEDGKWKIIPIGETHHGNSDPQ